MQYVLKFSICLVVLYIFYRAILRPLTFYQWNRFYLLCYSLLSFVIPFINVSPWLPEKASPASQLVNIIPIITNDSLLTANNRQPGMLQSLTLQQWMFILFCLGALVMLVRLLMQYLSLKRIRRASVLLSSTDTVQLYQTSIPVSPFSFGNAIYFNKGLHSHEELQRIIQHEFVHVKQKHSVDILVSELLCIVNWFNPFAWLVRHAIRQNLEFIADNDVIANGLNKKEYQYLLLKVVGVPQYSIASNFNFSNLKKRIAMMNKMKTARVHLTKFVFVLPLLFILLVAFRNKMSKDHQLQKNKNIMLAYIDSLTKNSKKPVWVIDGIPYAISAKGSHAWLDKNDLKANPAFRVWVDGKVMSMNEANMLVNRFEVSAIGASGNENSIKEYGVKGNLLVLYWKTTFRLPVLQNDTVPALPPPPPVPNVPLRALSSVADYQKLPENVENITHKETTDKRRGTNTNTVIVTLKNGNKEKYNLDDPKEKASYIDKYGPFPSAPPPPPPTAAPPVVAVTGVRIRPTLNYSNGKLEYGYTTPLYVIDGVVQQDTGILNKINPSDIKRIDVLKDKSAVDKYGSQAENGVVEIFTKAMSKADLIAAETRWAAGFREALLILNGTALPEGSKIEDFVKPDEIENINVLNNKASLDRYGDKAKKGVIEITTKNHPGEKKIEPPIPPAAVYYKFDNLKVNGKMTTSGNKISGVTSLKTENGRYRMLVLTAAEAMGKYGDSAANGALEITNLANNGKTTTDRVVVGHEKRS